MVLTGYVITTKQEKRDIIKRKDAMKTKSQWVKEVQIEFNKFIRLRDISAGHGCIDCGKPFEPNRPGGSVDAGHYLSRGSSAHLKFDPRNCFAQRKNCNRPGGTTREAFRAGVIARIGLEAVEALEADQQSRDYSIEDLRALKSFYRSEWKKLEACE